MIVPAMLRRRSSLAYWILSGGITILALADAAIHVRLDYVLFNGRLWGSSRPGPRPGRLGGSPGRPPSVSGTAVGGPAGALRGAPSGPPPGGHASNPVLRALDIARISGLPLNELFLLNAIGYGVLLLVFWIVQLRFPRWRGLMDLVLIVYTAASIVGWWDAGKPNPQNLGYLSKGIEAALILALVLHSGIALRALSGRRSTRLQAA